MLFAVDRLSPICNILPAEEQLCLNDLSSFCYQNLTLSGITGLGRVHYTFAW
jgi:hypothetical protein